MNEPENASVRLRKKQVEILSTLPSPYSVSQLYSQGSQHLQSHETSTDELPNRDVHHLAFLACTMFSASSHLLYCPLTNGSQVVTLLNPRS
jgi:hypothetical protein